MNVFKEYKREVATSIKMTQDRVEKELASREYVHYDQNPLVKLAQEIFSLLSGQMGMFNAITQQPALDLPPYHVEGDFAISLFSIAKNVGVPVNELAEKVANVINSKNIETITHATAKGPFVNLQVNRKKLYKKIIEYISRLGERYGESDVNAKKVVLIDYSAPNIAKPIGVGHLRSTIIGQALANIYEKTGYTVIKDNHLGDWGTQFGQLLYAYEHWGEEKKVASEPIHELKNLYVRFNDEAAKNPELQSEARNNFVKLEKQDPTLIALWKRFRDLSLQDFKKTYERFGITFDTNIGESYFLDKVDGVLEDCVKSGVAKQDSATKLVVVEALSSGDLPSFLLRKEDGSSLYLTRDLATLKFRIDTFHPDTILYVVGSEQELNFKQLFQLSKDVNYLPVGTTIKHIGFGMVLKEGAKMSTRKGTLIELKDLLEQSVEKSKEILLKKGTQLLGKEFENISEIIGVGAIIFNDLKQSREKNISFDWERMLNFEAGSAVYLQYTYTRIRSILRNLEELSPGSTSKEISDDKICFEKNSEFTITTKLILFPSIILQAQKTNSPHVIITYLEEVAQLFNSFYQEVSIVKTQDMYLQRSRVALSQATASVIKNGLRLLSIHVLEKM